MYRTFNTAGHHVVGFCTIFSQRTTSVYTFGEVCLCTLYSEYEIHSWYVLLLLVCWNMIHAAISKLWSEFHALICDPTSVSHSDTIIAALPTDLNLLKPARMEKNRDRHDILVFVAVSFPIRRDRYSSRSAIFQRYKLPSIYRLL